MRALRELAAEGDSRRLRRVGVAGNPAEGQVVAAVALQWLVGN